MRNASALTVETDAKPTEGSRIPGFYRLDLHERGREIAARCGLTAEDLDVLRENGLTAERADKMVENCIGVLALPVGLGLNFQINGRDYVVPMVVEEPSVVAAVSNTAQLVRRAGGFTADADPSLMIGQVQVVGLANALEAAAALEDARDMLLAAADRAHPSLRKRGGGARDLEVRILEDCAGPMVVVHVVADCCDAMGANAINSMAEGIAPIVESITGGRVNLRILSNLADRRLARASFSIPEKLLDGNGRNGADVAQAIVDAYRLADLDPYRAATHNKGAMNGIDAVAIATGNDWRSVEAGAHAYAAKTGRYRSLTRFWRGRGQLHASIELPMAVGTVGGSTRVHPTLVVLRKILGVDDARELAGVLAAVGLAQNFGALRALATEGIQRGHMTLHARSVALAAGAEGEAVDAIARQMVETGRIRVDVARTLLANRGEA